MIAPVVAARALAVALVLVLAACSGSTPRVDPPATAAPASTPLGFLAGPDSTPTNGATSEPDEVDPPALAIKVTKLTKSVRRGGTASISIKTAKKARCEITVTYDSGESQAKGLRPKTASSTGVITWKWTVGSRTRKDSYPIWIACEKGDRTGSVERSFTVK